MGYCIRRSRLVTRHTLQAARQRDSNRSLPGSGREPRVHTLGAWLRMVGHPPPPKTCFRMAVWPFRAGMATRRAHTKGFRLVHSRFPGKAWEGFVKNPESFLRSRDPPGAAEGQEEKDEVSRLIRCQQSNRQRFGYNSSSTERSWTSRKMRPPLLLASGLSSSLLERVNGP